MKDTYCGAQNNSERAKHCEKVNDNAAVCGKIFRGVYFMNEYGAVENQMDGMIREIEELQAENEKLKAENAELRATLSKMETVEKELRERLEKAVELPVKVGDTIYCIRNCGTGRYRVEEHTVIEVVFEYDNQMRIKTSYGLFGCEKWTFGLDCFADNAEAEARLKEMKEKNDDRKRKKN